MSYHDSSGNRRSLRTAPDPSITDDINNSDTTTTTIDITNDPPLQTQQPNHTPSSQPSNDPASQLDDAFNQLLSYNSADDSDYHPPPSPSPTPPSTTTTDQPQPLASARDETSVHLTQRMDFIQHQLDDIIHSNIQNRQLQRQVNNNNRRLDEINTNNNRRLDEINTNMQTTMNQFANAIQQLTTVVTRLAPPPAIHEDPRNHQDHTDISSTTDATTLQQPRRDPDGESSEATLGLGSQAASSTTSRDPPTDPPTEPAPQPLRPAILPTPPVVQHPSTATQARPPSPAPTPVPSTTVSSSTPQATSTTTSTSTLPSTPAPSTPTQSPHIQPPSNRSVSFHPSIPSPPSPTSTSATSSLPSSTTTQHHQQPPIPTMPTPYPPMPYPPVPTTTYVQDHKITLPPYKKEYKKSTEYQLWKMNAMLEISAHPKHCVMIFNDNGKKALQPYLESNVTQNSALFRMTVKALGQHASEFVATTDYDKANGYELWKRLDKHHQDDSTFFNRLDLRQQFDNIHMQPNESSSHYTNRFITTYDFMVKQGVTLHEGSDLILHYISSRNTARQFDDVITKLQTTYAHLLTKSIRDIDFELNTIEKMNAALNLAHSKRNPTPSTPAPPATPAPAPVPVPPAPVPAPAPGDNRPQQRQSPLEEAVAKFKITMQATSDHSTLLRNEHLKHTTTCPFHQNASHPFLLCRSLHKVCKEVNASAALAAIRSEFNLANAPAPPAPAPAPTPTPAPTPAPTPSPAPSAPAPAPPPTVPQAAPTPPLHPMQIPPYHPTQLIHPPTLPPLNLPYWPPSPNTPTIQQYHHPPPPHYMPPVDPSPPPYYRRPPSNQRRYQQRPPAAPAPSPAPAPAGAPPPGFSQAPARRTDTGPPPFDPQGYRQAMESYNPPVTDQAYDGEEGVPDTNNNNNSNDMVTNYLESESSPIKSTPTSHSSTSSHPTELEPTKPSSSPTTDASTAPSTITIPNKHVINIRPQDIHLSNDTVASLTTNINTVPNRHLHSNDVLRTVIDSGAFDNLFTSASLFESITYYDSSDDAAPKVILGDDSTTIPVKGYGIVNYLIHNKRIRQYGLFVPQLGQTCLLSVRRHIQSQGCYFHSENNEAALAFPTFILHPRMENEIDVFIRPAKSSNSSVDFDETTATRVSTKPPSSSRVTNRPQQPSTTSIMSFIHPTVHELVPQASQSQFTSTVHVKQLSPLATLPTRGTKGSIGYDVSSTIAMTIAPGEIAKVPTGLATAFENNMYIRVAPRSSLSLQHITVEAGVIDSDYRGEIKILLKNNSTKPFNITSQQRIAQFIFERAAVPLLEVVDNLPSSERTGGFGSTNKENKPTQRRIQAFRLTTHDIYLYDTKTGRYNRVAKPVVHTSVNPKDRRHHDSPHKEALRQRKDQAALHDFSKSSATSQVAREVLLMNRQASEMNDFHNQNNTDSTTETIDLSEDPDYPDNALDMLIRPINNAPDPPTMQDQPSVNTTVNTPSIPCSGRVNSAESKIQTISRDNLQRAIGFLSTQPLIKNMPKLSKQTLRVQRLPRNPELDPGEAATMPSKRRNTTPLTTTNMKYGDIWHLDIGFGPCTAIGGIRYTLVAVDRATRFKLVYGLKNLTTSLLHAIKKFLHDCGTKPSTIRTDFDNKLIEGAVRRHLDNENITVEAAPPYRQHQNGLVERHWQTVVAMSRNWLKSSLLPSKYWYFAVKRACEVSNILPVKYKEKITTPHELVYREKVDYRVLFPMFSTAYIKHPRHNGRDIDKWSSQSLKCIVVGTCNRSDSLLFYHPPSKQTYSCADNYKFDTFSPSGPQFNETYDANFIFNTQSSLDRLHLPPTHEVNETVYYKPPDSTNFIKSTVLIPAAEDDHNLYTIQEVASGNIHQVEPEHIHEADPSIPPINPIPTPGQNPFPHIPWIQHQCKATMVLQHFNNSPKQGFLSFNDEEKVWQFIPGRSLTRNEPVDLNNFHELAESMINNKKLFQGWKTRKVVLTARTARATSNIVSNLITTRKVSAANLHKLQAPTLLTHHKLHPDDRKTWDSAYKAEYDGLVHIDTWETITEEEYQSIKHLCKGLLPTMAIATIKYDGDGKPVRAKYRIVALGNLDPNEWSKADCFAPVLSQMELRFLTSLAVQKKCIPKTGDVTQAFCQSYLPKDEHYVLKPPPGCPITKPDTYWKLRKTLYGLRRSPRHFYELATKTLKAVGLQPIPSSPCIFTGTLIEGQPPIYLGLYVDDFIYFSESSAVERKFERDFGAKLDTDFNGKIGYFLGINFQCVRHKKSKDVSILMNQEAFIDNLVQMAGLESDAINEPKTPYRSGYPVDKIPNINTIDPEDKAKLTKLMQSLVGSLNWLSVSTRPDVSTITNMLAKYMSKPTPSHIDQAKRVIKYLKGTKKKGILFTTQQNHTLEAFVKFPIPTNQLISLSDANWGPQDASIPNPAKPEEVDLFKSRSVSGFLIWLAGPMHWISKRQTITARSSAEAEIYATDECTKSIQHLGFIIEDLNLVDDLMSPPTPIYNDNSACVHWSKNKTTKGLRHIQMRENAVRECVQSGFIEVKHIEGKLNLSDMFTKEDKDSEHFITIRDFIMSDELPLD